MTDQYSKTLVKNLFKDPGFVDLSESEKFEVILVRMLDRLVDQNNSIINWLQTIDETLEKLRDD